MCQSVRSVDLRLVPPVLIQVPRSLHACQTRGYEFFRFSKKEEGKNEKHFATQLWQKYTRGYLLPAHITYASRTKTLVECLREGYTTRGLAWTRSHLNSNGARRFSRASSARIHIRHWKREGGYIAERSRVFGFCTKRAYIQYVTGRDRLAIFASDRLERYRHRITLSTAPYSVREFRCVWVRFALFYRSLERSFSRRWTSLTNLLKTVVSAERSCSGGGFLHAWCITESERWCVG